MAKKKQRSGVLRFNHATGKVEEVGNSAKKPKGVARWPLYCDASGVAPDQVAEARADAREHGFTGVDFTPDGRAVYSCRSQHTQYLKHIGMYHRNAGYGDAMPDNR